MRGFFILVLVTLFLTPLAVQAGQISSAGNKGRWTSTDCTAPVAPGSFQKDPEAKANDLNAKVAAYNAYADDAKIYMDCVASEAERDAKAMSKLIIDEASVKLQEMSAGVQAASDALNIK